MRPWGLVLVFVALGCSGAEASPLQKKYPAPYTVDKFGGYRVSGLTLWLVTAPSVPDRSGARFVVGVDGAGAVLEGIDLYRRVTPGLAPDDLARRGFDILLGRAGGAALDPGTDKPLPMFPPEEWALVKPPAVAAGTLTFWFVEGEMNPELTRAELDLATGELRRRSANFVLHPPEAAIPGIRDKLRSQDPVQVREGLQQVAEHKELAPDVESLLGHPDSSLRMMAIGVLGNLRQERSIPALIQLLDNGPTWGDRSLAGQALLGRFATRAAVDAVRAHIARGGSGQEIPVLRDALKAWEEKRR